MVGQRKRRRTTKHTVPESHVSNQTTSTTQMPSALQASPQANSGILVLPSFSRDPHLVQTMQESLSNHSILPPRCCKLKSKGYLRKVQKLLPSRTNRDSDRRKEAGKMLDTDSRACRKGKHSDNPCLSGRSSNSLKYSERSRCSSRSRHSSSCYPSTWQQGTEDLKKRSDKNIDSKNSLAEILNCATLNRTPYDHRLNSPLKTDTGCQCRLKRRHEKAIQIPSKRIRSRTSCKLKKLKQLVSKHFSSVVAQQTQTSFKSKSHGKASRLGSYSLQQNRAYSGEEDNKKKAKFHNYGGYSPSETSVENSQDHLSRIEKISKPPKRIPSGRKSMVDDDVRGPRWSLHLANVQEIANYAAESVDYDYCLNACPKMIRCECKANDDIDNGEPEANDYNSKNWEITRDNGDFESNESLNITDGNIINARDDLDNEGYLLDEVGPDSYNGDSFKSKKWKNVGFCPDINCNRRCRHCSKIARETQCECANSRPPWSPYNDICKCCKCAETTYYNQFKNNYREFCTDDSCDRKCLPCREVTTQTPTGKESTFNSPKIMQGKQKSSETTNYNQFNNNYREFCTNGNCDRKCLPCREVTPTGKESTLNSPKIIQGKQKSSETTNYNQFNNNYREFCTNGNCERKCLPCREVTTQTPTREESAFDSPNIIQGNQKVSGVTSRRDSISEEEGLPKNNRSRRSLDSRKSTGSYHSKSINGKDKSKNPNSSDRSRVLKVDKSPLDNRSVNNNFGVPSPKISESIQSKSRNGRVKNSKTVLDKRVNLTKQKVPNQKSSDRSTKFKKNTSTLDALGEIPVHIESYSNQDTKRKVPEKKYLDDSKPTKSVTQKRQCSCLCIEAITQTSFFDLSCYCDRCGIAMRQVCRCYRNTSRPRRRASGTETSTFGGKYNGATKYLPDNHRYCTENRQPKCRLKKSVNRSRRSSEDRRHRRHNDEVRDCNSKTHQKRQSLGFPNHYSPVVKDSKSDLKQIIDILQKAVTGLELQQINKHQISTRNGMNGGRDSPLCNQESYGDFQHFEGITSCPNDTCGIPITQGNFPPKVNQEYGCQNNERRSPQSLYYCQEEYSPQPPGNEHPVLSRGTPIQVYNPEGAITSYPDPNVNGQSRKSHDSQLADQTLNYPNANFKAQISPYPGSDRDQQRNVQGGGIPHLTETNAQVGNHQMIHHTACEKGLNPKDQMSAQTPMYQGQNLPSYEAERSSPVYPKPPTLASRTTQSDTNFGDPRINGDNEGQPSIYTDANLNGQTLYYQEQVQQGQIPSYPNPIVKPYPQSNQMSPYPDPRHGDKIYQGPVPNHRFSNSLANETLKDFYQKEGPLRFQTRESEHFPYYQESHSFPQRRKFNTSRSLDEQQYLTDDCSERVQFVHRYDLDEAYHDSSTRLKYNENCENRENDEDYSTRNCNTKYNDEEAERDEVRNKQKTFPMLGNVQSSSRFWRVGFTDLHLPKDNKFRKSSGQSDVQSRTNKTYLPNCEKFIHESIDPIIQATWPLAQTVVQRRISMNPLKRNSFSMKQYYRSVHKMPHQREKRFTRTDKVDRNQGNKKYCKELPVDCNSKPKASQFRPRNEPSNHQSEVPLNLNCSCKNEETIRTIIPRSKRHKSHVSMTRLTSYDKHILRDFHKTKEVPWEPSKQASSDSTTDSIGNERETNCVRKHFFDLEESMCPCCGDSEMPKRDNKDAEPKTSKWNFPCMKPKEKRKEATNLFACFKMRKKEKKFVRPKHPKNTKEPHKNVEPKPSKNIFSCCKKPKKEKRKHSKDVKPNPSKNIFSCCIKPKKERREHSSNVELKPSRNLFACCKIPSKEKRESSSDFVPKLCCGMHKREKKEYSSSDVEPKPSKNIFACCSKPKKEKEEHSSDVEPKPSKNIFGCCSKLKREKEEHSSDVEPKPSKNIFACCSKLKREKKEPSTDVEPKPSKNIFACCSKLKREKKEPSTDVEPKPSKNIFACCSKLKREKKEPSTDVEPKPSKNIFACCSKLKREKKEPSTDVESKPSKNIFACCSKLKREKKEPSTDVEPKPSKNIFSCCKKKKEEVPKDVEAKPSTNIFACCKKPKKEPKKDAERKPSKNFFKCCKKLKIGKKKVPKDAVFKDAKPKPSRNRFICCKRPEKEERDDKQNYPPKKKGEKEAPKNVKPKPSKGLFPCCRMPSIESQEAPNGDQKKGSKSSWKKERISREKPEVPPKPQRERSQEKVKPKLGSLFSCRSKPKMEKRHKKITDDDEKLDATYRDKEVKVLFPCNSRFGCECSSDEDSAMCFNPRFHHDSTPVCSCIRSQSQSTNTTSSCDCESMDFTTDEHCECSSENHFYILFENQNSYNCKLQRRR